jgi:preprotein translocase SecE subunit
LLEIDDLISKEWLMAVAVKNTPEITTGRALNRLAMASVAGTAYFLGSIGVSFYAIPILWGNYLSPVLVRAVGSPVDRALMVLVVLAAIAGLIVLGRRLVGTNPPHGLRGGIFMGVVGVIVIALITRGIGEALERAFVNAPAMGLLLMSIIGIVLLVGYASLFFRPSFESLMLSVEDQGWFSTAAYKKSQGQRVRRGTMLSLLILAACGVYTLLSHGTLQTGSRNWELLLPFTGGRSLIVLPDVQFTVPIILVAAALWISYRVVNFPAFADFLIAVDAELNKVSWETRRRLWQDTIVVLTTVILLTFFLFIVDVFWFWFLSSRWIGVIQTGQTTAEKTIGPQDW